MQRPGQSSVIYFSRLVRATVFIAVVFLSVQAQAAFALTASYYDEASLIHEGTWAKGEQRMANGERFNENNLTCATRLYPLGTRIKVTNLQNGKTVITTVTDRVGRRFAETRIDLSRSAFQRIASLQTGLVPIKSEVVYGK